jgi:UDP-4-amino-4,6-dideoxy-N-acetyl-beta-L-altrosamine transaminase
MIPYGKQTLDEDDKKSIMDVLDENTFLTTGPRVAQFEKKICDYIGCQYGVAVNSGTAALHCATFAAGIQEGDEVIVPAISFVASANCILYQKGTPVFCDIDPNTMNIDVNKIEPLITEKTKAIIMVDMCGQPCHYYEIRAICDKYNLILIHDAAHSLGGKYKGLKVGSYADITCLSFHPVKNITTCEGGMMVTNNEIYYKKGQSCRGHGIMRDFKEREKANSHYYEMVDLGFNYRIPDVLCALGISQLNRLDSFIQSRNEIARKYTDFFKSHSNFIEPLTNHYDNAYHIYVVKLKLENIQKSRDVVFRELKEAGIGVNVHYMPIYLHPYYQGLGYKKGLCPESEKMYEQIITLPIYPLLKDEEVEYVCKKISECCAL